VSNWWGKDDRLSVNREAELFARQMIAGVRKQTDQLDAIIQQHAKNWRLERMSKVDRNLLRLSVWELLFTPETPTRVILNEALELAKCYGDQDSYRFVNGILDPLAKTVRKD
ncbi:MAG: transcription antitermination factor NusB, partial [Candidatus Hinthialibacter sp.]